jgi:hypothetical protein
MADPINFTPSNANYSAPDGTEVHSDPPSSSAPPDGPISSEPPPYTPSDGFDPPPTASDNPDGGAPPDGGVSGNPDGGAPDGPEPGTALPPPPPDPNYEPPPEYPSTTQFQANVGIEIDVSGVLPTSNGGGVVGLGVGVNWPDGPYIDVIHPKENGDGSGESLGVSANITASAGWPNSDDSTVIGVSGTEIGGSISFTPGDDGSTGMVGGIGRGDAGPAGDLRHRDDDHQHLRS